MSDRRRQQPPTGCVTLAAMIRGAREARRMSQERLAGLAGDRPSDWAPAMSRCRIAQWEGAHRAVSAVNLERLEFALKATFTGIDRQGQSSRHRETWCAAIAGELHQVICRSTGATLYDSLKEP